MSFHGVIAFFLARNISHMRLQGESETVVARHLAQKQPIAFHGL
jgi:hypothetical protein